MSTEVLKVAGQIAGIGGLALGVLLLVFRDVVRKSIFPTLTKVQGFQLLRLMLLLVWSVAVLGIVAWYYSSRQPSAQSNAVSQIVEQAKSYEYLFREYKSVRDELDRTKEADAQRRLKELEAELYTAKKAIEEGAAEIQSRANPQKHGGVEPIAQEAVVAWEACVKGGTRGQPASGGCSAILREGLVELK